jgi:hypothetical protein
MLLGVKMKFYVQAGSSAAERSEPFSFQYVRFRNEFVKIYLAGLLYLLLSVEVITTCSY